MSVFARAVIEDQIAENPEAAAWTGTVDRAEQDFGSAAMDLVAAGLKENPAGTAAVELTEAGVEAEDLIAGAECYYSSAAWEGSAVVLALFFPVFFAAPKVCTCA